MEVLSPNQPNLTLLICSITDIIRDVIPLFTAANYFNMTVSNKKALATLDTVHKRTSLFVSYFIFPPTYTYVNILYSVK